MSQSSTEVAAAPAEAPDLEALFDKDPLSYTRQDLDAIIADSRAKFAAFQAGNTRAGSTKPKAEAKPKPKPSADLQSILDLI